MRRRESSRRSVRYSCASRPPLLPEGLDDRRLVARDSIAVGHGRRRRVLGCRSWQWSLGDGRGTTDGAASGRAASGAGDPAKLERQRPICARHRHAPPWVVRHGGHEAHMVSNALHRGHGRAAGPDDPPASPPAVTGAAPCVRACTRSTTPVIDPAHTKVLGSVQTAETPVAATQSRSLFGDRVATGSRSGRSRLGRPILRGFPASCP